MPAPALGAPAVGPIGPVPGVAQAPILGPTSNALVGTFAPSTKVQVGNHRVTIERYLSEGGFAHVYVVKLPKPVNGSDVAVLKRVAVPDKEMLASMRTEVETMKRLKGHRHIVTYIDSHASALKGGGYEVFLLMEFCAGGGLIDFMNTRLQHRLTEPEILDIFADVAEGVACMHYLRPPLLHRDLKVENVLIAMTKSGRRYKLCDFGSAAPSRPAATSATEFRLIEEDIQRHTTLQYRSPEMVDIYRKQPIDEKSDIWALGVLLYKLCYYTTPFEEKGQLAILNASFRYPAYPAFSDRLKRLIAWMLREQPRARPNIYEVVQETCLLQGKEVPIKNIYAGRAHSEVRHDTPAAAPNPQVASPPSVGAFYAQPSLALQPQAAIDVVPMRRGRPQAPSQQVPPSKPTPSPGRGTAGDPFAALDRKSIPSTAASPSEDISSRFPAIEQFALLHDSGAKFDPPTTSPPNPEEPTELSKRVTEKLADEAFVRPTSSNGVGDPAPTNSNARRQTTSPERKTQAEGVSKAPRSSSTHTTLTSPPSMITPAIMTSPPPAILEPASQKPAPSAAVSMASSAPPTSHASSAAPPPMSGLSTDRMPPRTLQPQHASLGGRMGPPPIHRSKSQSYDAVKPTAATSRSSLDLQRTPSLTTPSSAGRRPASVYLESNLAAFHDRFRLPRRTSGRSSSGDDAGRSRLSSDHGVGPDGQPEETNIESNVAFLRAMEDEEGSRRRDKRRSGESRHVKRSSMPSISLSGTKTLLAGRFGDAFRRFEGHAGGSSHSGPEAVDSHRGRPLSPITMSERTGDRSDDDDHERRPSTTGAMGAEARRELERQALAQEERRVEAAAEDYRRRLADRSDQSGVNHSRPSSSGLRSKATSIQDSVRSVLGENHPPRAGRPGLEPSPERSSDIISPPARGDAAPRAPPAVPSHVSAARPVAPSSVTGPSPNAMPITGRRLASRPSAPPKPDKLRTGTGTVTGTGIPPRPGAAGVAAGPTASIAPATVEAWEASFSRRYPSLSQLEMVETDLDRVANPPPAPSTSIPRRGKDVSSPL